MSWQKLTLRDISLNIQTGPFGSQLHQSDYSEEGTPVVMPKDLVDGKISEESIARVEEVHVNRLSKHKIKTGDILYARRGDVGKCAFATNREKGWLCGTGCIRITVNTNNANPRFLFYHLQKPDTVGWIEKHAIGATMLNLNTAILGAVPIELPRMNIQNKVVDILNAYDDLIENNQKQIKLLEEAVKRLYKEWFVDLRFPGYEDCKIVDGVPRGWKYLPFSEIFDYVRGKSYTSKDLSETSEGILMVNLKNIRAFGGYNRNAEKRFLGKYKVEQTLCGGDIVMGVTDMTQERRLVGYAALVPNSKEEMTFSMDLIKIIPRDISKNFLYSTFSHGGFSRKISPLANGVNVLHLKPETMMKLEMLVPTREIEKKYSFIYEVYQMKIEVLQKQIDEAKQAREKLLHKLMRGEIDIQ